MAQTSRRSIAGCDVVIGTPKRWAIGSGVIGCGYRMLMLERFLANLIEQGARFVTLEEGAREWLERG